ncbi:VOC family protein [Flavobacterium magnum]|nr:VOC family protein [Flavobacterium magnum]
MGRISAYLTSNGNCRQAMQFYQACLGGELCVRELGDMPFGKAMPAGMRHAILQATLTKGSLELIATDLPHDDRLRRGNAITLMLHCDTEAELRRCYAKLSVESRTAQPVSMAEDGGSSAYLTDRFGNRWMLVCPSDMG